ncbi:MAG: OmpA family protein [bacterium]
MTAKTWIMAALVVSVAVTFGTGCKRTKNKTGAGLGQTSDLLNGTGSGGLGDGGLAGRDGFAGKQLVNGQFPTVFFDFDSAQVKDGERAKVAQVAEYLKANASATVVLSGHTDERGSPEYNMSLGENRALAVREALTQDGVDAGRMQTRSMGEEQPKNPGHDESAWAQNRRVEFEVLGSK